MLRCGDLPQRGIRQRHRDVSVCFHQLLNRCDLFQQTKGLSLCHGSYRYCHIDFVKSATLVNAAVRKCVMPSIGIFRKKSPCKANENWQRRHEFPQIPRQSPAKTDCLAVSAANFNIHGSFTQSATQGSALSDCAIKNPPNQPPVSCQNPSRCGGDSRVI